MRDRVISRLVAVVAASLIVGTLLIFGGTSRAAQLQRPIICCTDSAARPPGPRDRFAVAKPIPFQRLQRQLASSPIGASRSDEAFLKMADQTARFAPSLDQPVHVSLLSRSERPAGRRRCRHESHWQRLSHSDPGHDRRQAKRFTLAWLITSTKGLDQCVEATGALDPGANPLEASMRRRGVREEQSQPPPIGNCDVPMPVGLVMWIEVARW